MDNISVAQVMDKRQQAQDCGHSCNTMLSETSEPLLTCEDCGHTGPDVGWWQSWVGGRGYVWRRECTDMPACWRRRGW